MPMKVQVYAVLQYNSETQMERSAKFFADESEAEKYLTQKLHEDKFGIDQPNEYYWAHEMFTGEVELEDDDLTEYLGGGE